MANSNKNPEKRQSILNNNYPTIGLLTEGLSGEYQAGVWPGIAETVSAHNVNLICFCGGSLSVSSQDPWDSQGNVLYDIAEKNDLDGLIIAGSLGSYVSDNALIDFLNRFKHLPAVTLAPAMESIPAVFVDNRSGMRSLITHLVVDHNYRKFAFIRGPEGNAEAEERFSIFKDILEEHKIPLDPNCLLPGDFTRNCGAEAVNKLISSNTEFEVIVAADDDTALGALQALQAHGKNIPEDVALVGFDDIEESRYVTPPLTTVNQPLYDLGKTAVEMLLRLINGNKIPQNTILKAKLTIRQSCGCFKHFTNAEINNIKTDQKTPTLNSLSEEKVFEYIRPFMDHSYSDITKEIINSFCQDVNNRVHSDFLKNIDRLGHLLTQQDIKLSAWPNIFYKLWNYTFIHLDKESFAFADDLLHRARTIRGEVKLREQGVRRIKTIRENYFLHEIGDVLKNTLDIDKLLNEMCKHLPQLGISTFYLSIDIAQWGLGMDESGPVKLIPPKEAGATRGLKLIYANGVEMTHEDFGRGWAVEFNGTKGTIRVSRDFLESDPKKILKAKIPEDGVKLYHSDDHYQDWLDCIVSREKPICDVEIGHRTSSVCNISNIAYKIGKDLDWDPVAEKFNDAEANKWLTKKYRKEFKVK